MKSGWSRGMTAAIALICCVGVEAEAQTVDTGPAASPYTIEAQDLSAALLTLSRQSKRSVFFDASLLATKRAPRIERAATFEDALRQLLSGTGLRFEITPDGSAVVLRQEASASPARPPAPLVREAQKAAAPEELIVTGSRLGPGTNVPIEVKTYSAARIAESGQTNLTNFLNTLPEVSVGSRGGPTTSFGGQDTVRLRGLPPGSTSLLLDGRRLGNSATGPYGFFDLNLLPSVMIDRIDIVPVGGSAVYGSDAVGGVVNIITKKKFEGADAEAGISFADGYNQKTASAAAGHNFGRFQISGFATFAKNVPLYGYERELTRDSNFTRYASKGGVDWRNSNCDPGTVSAANGVLAGLGTTSAAIPASGAGQIANYRAGQSNLCSSYSLFPFVPARESYSFALDAAWDVTDELTVYAKAIASQTGSDLRKNGVNVTGASVPATNAFNPFGQAVRVTTILPVFGGNEYKSRGYRPLVGATGNLWGDFTWSIEAWMTILRDGLHDESQSMSTEFNALLASSNPAQALNLFEPRSNGSDILHRAYNHLEDLNRAQEQSVQGVVRGSPFDLPAGAVKVAAGAEFRHEWFSSRAFNQGSPSQYATGTGKRDVGAFFAEAHAPVLVRNGREILSLDVAGRYDHYTDFGNSFVPQFGARLVPFDGLVLRTTYSEAFKAPQLKLLRQSQIRLTDTLNTYLDPRRNERITNVAYLVGGNPNLGPESGRAKTIGADWTPSAIEGLKLSATYWQIKQSDRINNGATIDAVLSVEGLFPGRVMRGPPVDGRPGQILLVDTSVVNFGGLRLDGFDLGVSYRIPTQIGTFIPSVDVTRALSYRSQITPGAPYLNRLGRADIADVWSPRWKGTAGVNWEGAGFSANFQARYVGEYLDFQSRPNTNRLGNFVLFDASMQADLGTLPSAPSWLKGTRLRVGMVNMFDRAPDYSNNSVIGFDPSQYDLLGRVTTITLGRTF
jgi:iron complex outermembrane recepter protein